MRSALPRRQEGTATAADFLPRRRAGPPVLRFLAHRLSLGPPRNASAPSPSQLSWRLRVEHARAVWATIAHRLRLQRSSRRLLNYLRTRRFGVFASACGSERFAPELLAQHHLWRAWPESKNHGSISRRVPRFAACAHGRAGSSRARCWPGGRERAEAVTA